MLQYTEIALLQPIEFIGYISIAPYRLKFQWVRLRENYFVQSPNPCDINYLKAYTNGLLPTHLFGPVTFSENPHYF